MKVKAKQRVTVEPKTIHIFLKVSDQFYCKILDGDTMLKEHDGYVPDFMPGDHYGDYVDLEIDLATGQVLNWRPPHQMEAYMANFLSEEE